MPFDAGAVYNPLTMLPRFGLSDHCTFWLGVPSTTAVNNTDCWGCRNIIEGLIDIYPLNDSAGFTFAESVCVPPWGWSGLPRSILIALVPPKLLPVIPEGCTGPLSASATHGNPNEIIDSKAIKCLLGIVFMYDKLKIVLTWLHGHRSLPLISTHLCTQVSIRSLCVLVAPNGEEY